MSIKFVPKTVAGVAKPQAGGMTPSQKAAAEKLFSAVATDKAKVAVAAKLKPLPKAVAQAESQAVVWAKELIDLDTRMKEAEAYEMVTRIDALKKSLQSVISESGADPAKDYIFHTSEGDVQFSSCSNTTVIEDQAKMIKLLGPETTMAIAKFNIGDIKKYLSAIQLGEISKTVPGSRRLLSITPVTS